MQITYEKEDSVSAAFFAEDLLAHEVLWFRVPTWIFFWFESSKNSPQLDYSIFIHGDIEIRMWGRFLDYRLICALTSGNHLHTKSHTSTKI